MDRHKLHQQLGWWVWGKGRVRGPLRTTLVCLSPPSPPMMAPSPPGYAEALTPPKLHFLSQFR